MAVNKSWINADELLAKAHPDQVMQHYGVSVPNKKSGNNYRVACPINECDSEKSSYGQLSIELTPPYKIHSFCCGLKGNLFDLMWVAKHGKRPSGNKLRGAEFKEVLEDLAQILDGFSGPAEQVSAAPAETSKQHERVKPLPNIPLAQSENERTRELVDLWQQTTTDPAEMTPAASRYFRNRKWLTSELCKKWGVGYLPNDSKGTLRGRFIYRIDSVGGKALAYAGRDPDFDARKMAWKRKPKGMQLIKTRFPSEKYFRKGLELYGQQASRLAEPGYQEAIRETGILCVEGFNDVLALDAKSQPSVGALGNRLTADQVDKLLRFAHEVGGHKVTLMFDRNEQGQIGQQEAMAKLSKHVPVLDGWSGYQGDAEEPEQLTDEEWQIQREIITTRWKMASTK